MKFNIASCLINLLPLTGCGKEEQATAEREEAATPPPLDHEPLPPLTEADGEAASAECGQGGTQCPDGLECVTFRGGQQACGPLAGEMKQPELLSERRLPHFSIRKRITSGGS